MTATLTRCSYAACTAIATHHADDWPFCRGHLQEHTKLMREDEQRQYRLDELARQQLAAQRAQDVLRLARHGLGDEQIGVRLGISGDWAGELRRRGGIACNPQRIAACGTRAGYQRHRRVDEQPCQQCSQAEKDYQAARHRRRREAAA